MLQKLPKLTDTEREELEQDRIEARRLDKHGQRSSTMMNHHWKRVQRFLDQGRITDEEAKAFRLGCGT